MPWSFEAKSLFAGMTVLVILYSFYLGSRNNLNPYKDRSVFKDAKAGNFWARICLIFAFLYFIFMIFSFVNIIGDYNANN
nr:hypothetical protein [uncultured Albidiferax sp.]